MTAVDHAELKRLAEGATLGKWHACVSGLPAWRNVEYFVESDHPGVNEGDTLVCTTNTPDSRDAAFIAAANPAVVLELLSEIEGLKAERDTAQSAVEAWAHVCESVEAHLQDRIAMHDEANPERYLSILRSNMARVIEPDNNFILAQAQSLSASKSEDAVKSLAWNLRVYHRRLFDRGALRPQTAESGK